MSLRKFLLVMAGFVAAIVVLLFAHRVSEPEESGQAASLLVPVAVGLDVSQQEVEADQRMVPASGEAGAIGQKRGPAQDRAAEPVNSGTRPTLEEELRNINGALEKVESRWLLEAGFSQDRIDWLVRRKSELLAKRKQEAMDSKQSGGPPGPLGLAAALDDDLLLRDEMAEDEYTKYRQALRKSTAVSVERVLPGSFADQAGLMPGDQVVRYDGKRVYSDLELNSLARSGQDGHDAQVEVLRGDQTVMMVMPKGDTGISKPPESFVKDTVGRAIAKAREARAGLREPNP